MTGLRDIIIGSMLWFIEIRLWNTVLGLEFDLTWIDSMALFMLYLVFL